MKKYYINTTEVTKEILILNMTKHVSDNNPKNDLESRNKIYKEVSILVNERSLMAENHTFNIDVFTSFHIIEHKKKGVVV